MKQNKFGDEFYYETASKVLKFGGQRMSINEKPTAKLRINRADINHFKFFGTHLVNNANIAFIEVPLMPYRDLINLNEVTEYFDSGEAILNEETIIIKNGWLIQTLGMLRLIKDMEIENNDCLQCFEFTNYLSSDTNIDLSEFIDFDEKIKPHIRSIRLTDPEYKVYKELASKYSNKIDGLYKLRNMDTYFKYNAIKYFYHVNSYYRDNLGEIVNNCDKNVIYMDQLEEKITAYYLNETNSSLYRILNSKSMLDLILNLSLINGRINKEFDFKYYHAKHQILVCKELMILGRPISSDDYILEGNLYGSKNLNTNLKDRNNLNIRQLYDNEDFSTPMFIPAVLPIGMNIIGITSKYLGLIENETGLHDQINELIEINDIDQSEDLMYKFFDSLHSYCDIDQSPLVNLALITSFFIPNLI